MRRLLLFLALMFAAAPSGLAGGESVAADESQAALVGVPSGTWHVKSTTQLIVSVNTSRRYRIYFKSTGNTTGVNIIVNGTTIGPPLKSGEARDVEGSRIEIAEPNGIDSTGSYTNLD